MKRVKKNQRQNGFTLAELLVTLGIFGIIGLSVLTTCVVANNYWLQGNRQSASQENARTAFATIVNELRQAQPDADPGTLNPATGFLSIVPAVAPTGVLAPNANAAASSVLTFTEGNMNYYTPFAVGWNPDSPLNYKLVSYQVQGGRTLQRTETTYNADGSVSGARTDVALATKLGTITLQAAYLAQNYYNVSIVSNESGKTYSLNSNVYLEEQ